MIKNIILASASPRRRELFSKLNIPFEVYVSGCDENTDTKDPKAYVMELSARKARAVKEELGAEYLRNRGVEKSGEHIILGADTVVVSKGLILGKPKDDDDAFRMLEGYRNDVHYVYTGVTLIDVYDSTEKTFCAETAVRVGDISDEEIRTYIATGECSDKAGAYAIQGGFEPFIESIKGEYSNVVGLPLAALRKAIKGYRN